MIISCTYANNCTHRANWNQCGLKTNFKLLYLFKLFMMYKITPFDSKLPHFCESFCHVFNLLENGNQKQLWSPNEPVAFLLCNYGLSVPTDHAPGSDVHHRLKQRDKGRSAANNLPFFSRQPSQNIIEYKHFIFIFI